LKKEGITLATLAAACSGDIENAIVASTPGGIERQEAAGQTAFVGTPHTLPKECPEEQLRKLGFTFGPPVDDLFLVAYFPPGWSKKATDHAMWSDLLDAKGRKRAAIFYKAAFYDRSAHMQLMRRYVADGQYLKADGTVFNWAKDNERDLAQKRAAVIDHATGEALWFSEPWPERNYTAGDIPQQEAKKWLAEHFPEHEDPTAYWD
jgi:hypothetical protein